MAHPEQGRARQNTAQSCGQQAAGGQFIGRGDGFAVRFIVQVRTAHGQKVKRKFRV
jgi:hypothetical protein